MNPVLKRLILKDVKLNLPIMTMMVLAGIVALFIMSLGKAGYAVGGILYITANIAGGIFIGMYCIVQERKDQSMLFALSLPVSVRELNTVKFVAALLVYTGPWLVLSLVLAGVHFVRPEIPRGLLVYAIILQGSFFALVAVYFAMIATSRSEAVAGFGILLLNMGFSLFMVWVNQPPIQQPLRTDHLVWTTPAVVSLIVEIVAIVAAVVGGIAYLARRREIA
jgi:ABC-type transport system involved in multi-copper enzyme maturation permease subunit